MEGWTFEDSSMLVKRALPRSDSGKIFIGFTPAPKDIPLYGTILEMLADGWGLLGAPQRWEWKNDDDEKIEQWDWWLQRK